MSNQKASGTFFNLPADIIPRSDQYVIGWVQISGKTYLEPVYFRIVGSVVSPDGQVNMSYSGSQQVVYLGLAGTYFI